MVALASLEQSRDLHHEAWLLKPVRYEAIRKQPNISMATDVTRSGLHASSASISTSSVVNAEAKQGTSIPFSTAPAPPHPSAPEPASPTSDSQPPTPLSESFPAFDHAVSPVSLIPDWGAMTSPDQWNRTFREMKSDDFVAVPSYNIAELTMPMLSLLKHRDENRARITAKLYYSTRFFGAYDLDAGEFSANHPGIDLKLALGTPVGAIGGGRVYRVHKDANLGLHVIVEHRVPKQGIFFSIYGHLAESWVSEGDDLTPGQTVGTVGMTGNTSAPHLHLQIDRATDGRPHTRYWPQSLPTPSEAARFVVHPIRFITEHR